MIAPRITGVTSFYENWIEGLFSKIRTGNPPGYAHRVLDDLADKMITDDVKKQYIAIRNADKEYVCRKR
jgi:hypothetical protein